MPIVLIGANVNNKPNYNVLGNFGVIQLSSPTIIYISPWKHHYTTQGIKENNTYSVNIPSTEVVQKTDYCGTVSGHKVDKSGVFKPFYGELRSAPMIMECPINFECKVIRYISDITSDADMFVAEIVEVYVSKQYLTERNEIDIKRVAPILIGIDRHYWILGNHIAEAFNSEKKLKK